VRWTTSVRVKLDRCTAFYDTS